MLCRVEEKGYFSYKEFIEFHVLFAGWSIEEAIEEWHDNYEDVSELGSDIEVKGYYFRYFLENTYYRYSDSFGCFARWRC